MSQCLRCSKPCEATSVFCETCRSLLRNQLWQEENILPEGSRTSPVVAMSSGGDPLERITGPQPLVRASQVSLVTQLPQTPQPPSLALPEAWAHGPAIDYLPPEPDVPDRKLSAPSADCFVREQNAIDLALCRLNEAARRIAEVEQGPRRLHRASRLSPYAPIHDISADIQRQSSPLPQLSKIPESDQGEQGEDLGQRLPDLWPWLQEADADEDEPGGSASDHWSNSSDPLKARHFPNIAEVARIEEEDLRRARAEGLLAVPIPPKRVSSTHRRVHTLFIVFAILALAFLVVDSVLLSVIFKHPHRPVAVIGGPPSLTLSSNVASVGQTIVIHIHHFSAHTHVFLTHDIEETVELATGSPLVQVGPMGSADVIMLVDASWGPGFHSLQAEDVMTRYTASTTLQIVGAGPTRPSQLVIGTTSLDLGADVQSANTIQALTLHNSGGGAISWTGSSNAPWLLLSPSQGIFSASQTISVAVERANLNPGDYKGMITFASNVGAAQWIQVQMSVRPLPPNIGPVLEVIPPVLSFTALDGGPAPNSQTLLVNNPGSQALQWSLISNNPVLQTSQSLLRSAFNSSTGWLSTDQTSGMVVPRGSSLIHILVHSHNLLPGVYTDVLAFSGNHGTSNSPQSVSVSLTVQPRCSLTLSTGILSFTAVSGQSNPSSQSLSFSTTASCAGAINWKAISAANWLTITPANGQLKGSASVVTAVGVNASILKPGTYASAISLLAAQSTQTVMVQLAVQKPPSPLAPIMGATPLDLNFNTTQGMPNPPGQVVTITNTGEGRLRWRTMVNTLASSWLGAGPTGGGIPAGRTGQVTVYINTAGLTPNTYIGQVILIGTDKKGATAAGSPQTITVNLLVLPPCILQQPSLSAVAFSSIQGTTDPNPQSIAIVASGNCDWPMNWQVTAANAPAWLKLSSSSGSFAASGQSASITIAASIAGLATNTYTTQITITASDGSTTPVQGSPQTISVTLNVLPPCSLQVGSSNLAFSIPQGQPAPPAQSVPFSEVGSCSSPVSWSVKGDAGSSGWLILAAPTSGTGNGSITVGVNPQNLALGTLTGTITLSASGSGGAVVQGSPQTINVTLTVTGYTLSGTAIACSDINCATSEPLPGASLSLVNNTTNQTLSMLADGSGNYSFANLELGAYTLTITGIDGTSTYAGTVTLNITGNQSNLSVNAYPK